MEKYEESLERVTAVQKRRSREEGSIDKEADRRSHDQEDSEIMVD
jgi:hypothetical protein